MNAPRSLQLSPRAIADLEDIADYLEQEAPEQAVAFLDALQARCAIVARSPQAYPARHDLAPDLRLAVHGRYMILFRDLPDQQIVRIERVLHGARNIPRLL